MTPPNVPSANPPWPHGSAPVQPRPPQPVHPQQVQPQQIPPQHAPPNWAAPDPASMVRRPRRGWTTLLVALVGLSALAAMVIGAAPPAGLPGQNAAVLIGDDGHHQVLTDGSSYVQDEWAHLPGGRVIYGRVEFFYAMLDDQDAVLTTTWLRRTRTELLGEQSHVLYSLDDDGLRTRVEVAGAGFTGYQPGRLDVPGDVQAGSTWQSSGVHNSPRGEQPYQSSGRAEAAPEHGAGCLRIELTDTVGDQVADPVLRTWCPDRGVVTDAGYEPGELEASPRGSTERAWQPEGWRLHDALPARAGIEMSPIPITGPLGTNGRALAMQASGDVLTFDDTWELDTMWHPGGQLTAGVQVGDSTIVASSQRTITSYDPRGWRRWQISTDDVIVQLVPVDADEVLAVNSAGTIHKLHLDDGATRWEHAVPGAALEPVLADTRHVFTVSGAEQITVLDVASGEPAAVIDLPEAMEAMAGADGLVVALGVSGRVWAFDTDGNQRWQANLRAAWASTQMTVTQDLVAIGHDHGLTVFQSADGTRLWSDARPVETLVADGDVLVAASATGLTVYRGGAELQHWPMTESYATADRWCRALKDGVSCIDGMGTMVEVGR